ncbi:unnamed protein product (mitochondrion) [Plasmodiophora brassicae]|uniref:Structural maintenance of chromosomes protein n=1 Tax=Plasmodiophora brassicae TaxID=37360 RepID=A0A0G4J106_PLABS|nr:hypothetical protein PBRA_008484 [Plasmodiophora brassicae]SPR00911.1 unnamed protein product [Plasmodiophora brassicae]
MYIDRLVIEGFKSYKDRVEVQFAPGLNVILGRNGAGKSNVFAAIEFVLSNKYSSLRAEDRQRLLHEGSGRAVLAAYVELVFNNKDRRFPDDKDVVTLRRVIGLKKDEFLLNNRHVSKTQVDNLLESAGFSRSNPYNIVQQGKVNALVKMTDKARLDLLKEIAGTRVYDQRRAESLRIMHDTDSCTAQIAEISESLEARLQELEGEQEELRQYQALDRERRSLEYTIFTLEQNSAERKLAALENDRQKAHKEAEQTHAEAASIAESLTNIESEIALLEGRQKRLHDQKQVLQAHLQTTVKERARCELVARDHAKHAAGNAQRRQALTADLEELEKRIGEVRAQLSDASAKFEDAKQAEVTTQARLDSCRIQLDELYAKRGRSALFKSRSARDAYLREQIRKSEQACAVEREKEKAYGEELQALESRLQDLKSRHELASQQIQQSMAESQQVSGRLGELKKARDDATNERKQLWRQESQFESDNAELKERLHRAETSLYSTMPRDVRLGLQAVKEICAERKITGVFGMVCELFTTEPTFYQCVQTTAGNRLFHVVVDTDETASVLLENIRRMRAGRVTFMPLNKLKVSPSSMYVESSDAIPMLDKLVFKPQFLPAMSQLFGKTVIVRNLDVGAAYSREHGMNAITLDGDQVNKKGAMTGGFVDTKASPLKAMADLNDVRNAVAAAGSSASVRERARIKDQEVAAILGDMQACDAQRRALRDRIVQAKDETAQVDSERAIVESELASKRDAVHACVHNIEQLEASIQAQRTELSSPFRASLSEAESARLASLTEEIESLNRSVIAISERRAKCEADRAALADDLSMNLVPRQRDLRAALDALQEEDAEVGEDGDADTELASLRKQETDTLRELERIEGDIAAAQSRIGDLTAQAETIKARESEIRVAIQEHTRRMEKIVNRASLLMNKKDSCVRSIRALGSLPSAAFETYGSQPISSLMDSLAKCNTELKKYSHVNKKAIDQFTAFTEQRAQLRDRKAELDRGKVAIEQCIAHLDHQKEEAIRRTFKGIAKNFSQVFAELVPGGKATLVIQTRRDTDVVDSSGEEDSHEEEEEEAERRGGPAAGEEGGGTDRYTGVGIKVSFTGAGGTVLAMTQLSGGQQTIVALALIFAIQRCDPFPFYLFDEIDSNLDSAHRAAVAQMIARQSRPPRSEDDMDVDGAHGSGEEAEEADLEATEKQLERETSSRQTQFICTTFRPELSEYAAGRFGVFYANKVSQVRAITAEEGRAILESSEAPADLDDDDRRDD